MQMKVFSRLLLLVVIGSAVSVESTGHFDWPFLLKKLLSINFYKQLYEYIQAIMNEGIPALHIPPLDPMYLDKHIVIFRAHNPYFPDYTDLEIHVNGINLAGFSDFTIRNATVLPEAMAVLLILKADAIILTSTNITATAVNVVGRIVHCDCTYTTGDMYYSTFKSFKQLQVNGGILQVTNFDLEFQTNFVWLDTGGLECSGDEELEPFMSDTILNALAEYLSTDLPAELKALSENITTVLNDVFALRNITYEDRSSLSHRFQRPQSRGRQQSPVATGQRRIIRNWLTNRKRIGQQ